MTEDGQPNGAPRWLVVLAWATGPAGLYVLLSLAHAAVIERVLTVDVAFGRSLAFWVGATYLALLAWAFLPPRPRGRWAGRGVLAAWLVLGGAGACASVVFGALWLTTHWVTAVGLPVVASLAVLVVAAVGVLRLAAHDDRRSADGQQ